MKLTKAEREVGIRSLWWILLFVACVLIPTAHGQGIVNFSNRVVGSLDVPVRLNGIPTTREYYPTLEAVANAYGAFVVGLIDADTGVVYATTTFRTDSLTRIGYINAIGVDIGTGTKHLRMAYWMGSADAAGYAEAKSGFWNFAESQILTVTGGIPPASATTLIGLNGMDTYTYLPFPAGCADSRAQETRYIYTKANGGVRITGYNCLDSDTTIPETLEGLPVIEIGPGAFISQIKLHTIKIPSSVYFISSYAFYENINLRSIEMSEGLFGIGPNAFESCFRLRSIHIPNSVVFLGDRAFSDCGVSSVSIGDGVAEIGRNAFWGCSLLSDLRLPRGLVSIGSEAFDRCSSLVSLTIPSGVTSIGNAAFRSSGVLSVEIPAGIKSIEYSSFEGCSSLTNVSMKDGLLAIGNSAFNGCNLIAITIPSTVTNIGKSAFNDCAMLSSITLPEGLVTIGESCFNNCSSLPSITIPSGVTSIGIGSFYLCLALTNISTSADNPAYNSLEGVLFSKDLKTLLHYPMGRSGNTYEIPANVTNISEGGFRHCANLTHIAIPNHVTSIGDAAFFECSSLTSINSGEGVEYIGFAAFRYCISLTNVVVERSGAFINSYAFADCSSLKKVQLPRSVPVIGSWNFYNCTNLVEINIPAGVNAIGACAFLDCRSLKSVTIPKSTYQIDQSAFGNCSNLSRLFFEGNAPSLGGVVFEGAPATAYYLPKTAGWGPTFGEIRTKLWNPKIVLNDGKFGIFAGKIGFNLEGGSDVPIVIEACSNLRIEDWKKVGAIAFNALGTANFSDPDSSSNSSRFYRFRPE